MIKGQTKTGFDFEMNENLADNIELLDELVRVNEGDVLAIPKVTQLLLDNDTRTRLYEHCRKEDGRVPIMDVFNEVVEMIGIVGRKNL